MLQAIEQTLTRAGVPSKSVSTLAEAVAALGPDQVAGASPARIALLATIVASSEHRQYEEAIEALHEHLNQVSRDLVEFDLVRLWHMRGFYYWRRSKAIPRATRALNRSLEWVDALCSAEAKRYLPRIHDTYGQLLQDQGLLEDARVEYVLALRYRENQEDEDGLALTLGNIGRLCMEQGDFPAAAEYLRRDLEIVEQRTPERTRLRTQLLSQLGSCLLEMGELEEAKESFAASRILAAEDRNKLGLCFVHLNLARVALLEDDPGAASVEVQIAREGVDSPDIDEELREAVFSVIHQRLAEVELTRGNTEQAVTEYEIAWHHAESSNVVDALVKAQLLFGYARALKFSERTTEAATLMRNALRQLDATTADDLRRCIEGELQDIDPGRWLLHSAGRFVGHDAIEFLLTKGGHEGFHGDEKNVVILFSDNRGFTHISESLSPRQLIEHLNRYLGYMTRCIEYFGGMVDKFIGDSVMAIFSLPEPRTDDAERAALATLFMQADLVRFNRNLPEGAPTLAAGIGLHMGSVVAGLIGSPQHRSYTVIGDAVNTASRLEGMTKQLGATILVSSDVVESLQDRDRFLLRPLGRYRPKGRVAPVEVFDLMGENDGSRISQLAVEEIQAARTAIAAFEDSEFDRACQLYRELEAQHQATPRALGYRLLASHAERLRAEPPPAEWRGEITLSEK